MALWLEWTARAERRREFLEVPKAKRITCTGTSATIPSRTFMPSRRGEERRSPLMVWSSPASSTLGR
jgi:hypothetical protein